MSPEGQNTYVSIERNVLVLAFAVPISLNVSVFTSVHVLSSGATVDKYDMHVKNDKFASGGAALLCNTVAVHPVELAAVASKVAVFKYMWSKLTSKILRQTTAKILVLVAEKNECFNFVSDEHTLFQGIV